MSSPPFDIIKNDYVGSVWFGHPQKNPDGSGSWAFTMALGKFADHNNLIKTAFTVAFGEYAKGDWGGVAWAKGKPSDPNVPAEAKQLTFWAVGAKGGERVTFAIQFDANTSTPLDVTLTNEWKQYTIGFTPQPTPIQNPLVWSASADTNGNAAFGFAIGAGDGSIMYS